MGQSRQGVEMKHETKHIIDNPGSQAGVWRKTDLLITAIAWGLWVYLAMPLVTLLMWAIGIRLLVVQQVMLEGYRGLLSVVGYYIAGAMAIGLVLMLINIQNRRRFRGKDRRAFAKESSAEDIAQQFGVPSEFIDKMRNAKIATVDIEHGQPVVELGNP